MTMTDALIAELKAEAATTRKLLALVPVDRNDWKPHEKSMKLGNLAAHVAELAGWVTMILTTDELDFAQKPYKPFIAEKEGELVAQFDKTIEGAIAALQSTSAEEFGKNWTLRSGDHMIFTMPKAVVLRSFAFSHMYHHRGQLSVYLRLLDIPIPGMYGPSADER